MRTEEEIEKRISLIKLITEVNEENREIFVSRRSLRIFMVKLEILEWVLQ